MSDHLINDHLSLEQALTVLLGWLGDSVWVLVGAAVPSWPWKEGDPGCAALVHGELVRGAEARGTQNPYEGESYEFTVGTPPQGFVIDSEVFVGAHLLENDAADVLVVMLNPLRLEVVRRHGPSEVVRWVGGGTWGKRGQVETLQGPQAHRLPSHPPRSTKRIGEEPQAAESRASKW
jgi:hypothetical protein